VGGLGCNVAWWPGADTSEELEPSIEGGLATLCRIDGHVNKQNRTNKMLEHRRHDRAVPRCSLRHPRWNEPLAP
jgi:hypothetical protein